MAEENGKKEENGNREKIEVDKDFLMKVLKMVEDVKREVSQLKQGGLEVSTKNAPSLPDHIFQCVKLISIKRVPPTPEDIVRYQQTAKEFEKKLEELMKNYKIIQLTAMFLKKL